MTLQQIMNNTRSLVVVVDSDLDVVYSNRVDAHNVIDAPIVEETVKYVLAYKKPVSAIETRMALPNLHDDEAPERDVNIDGEYAVIDDAEYAVLTITDITPYKRDTKGALLPDDSGNQEVVRSVFAALSHEIRTPLNAILGFSKLLPDTSDPDKREKYANVIEYNIQLLQQLLNDALDVSKLGKGMLRYDFKRVNINQIMNVTYKMAKNKVPESILVNLVLEMPEFYMTTDSERLSQILINLLSNACKFTARGSITIGYTLRSLDEILFYVKDTGKGVSEEDKHVIFERYVTKGETPGERHGMGLGLAICKSLVTTMHGTIGVDSFGEGHGSTFWFTLPVNHPEGVFTSEADSELVDAMMLEAATLFPAATPLGVVPMENPNDGENLKMPEIPENPEAAHNNDGTTHAPMNVANSMKENPEDLSGSIMVPNPTDPTASLKSHLNPPDIPSHQEVARVTPTLQSADPGKSGKPIVLVAEDNDSNYLLFESILEENYEVVHARDGQQAINLFSRVHPDLVLMDISMPRMDGYEATSIIRKTDAKVPIIAVTAYAFATDQDVLMRTGFSASLTKPINAEGLLGVVKRLLK